MAHNKYISLYGQQVMRITYYTYPFTGNRAAVTSESYMLMSNGNFTFITSPEVTLKNVHFALLSYYRHANNELACSNGS